MRHFDAEQELYIGEKIYILRFLGVSGLSGAVGLLKAVYWLVQVGRCQNIKFYHDSMVIGFEQSKSYLRVFRKATEQEVELVVVVHVEDILVHTKHQATMETFAAELGRKFKLKDIGDTKYYMGCMITRNRKALEVKARPTLKREVGDGDVRCPESKQGTSVFGGANPLKSG